MAEFLIRAQASKNEKASQVGDIIVVRPDGHEWGKCECLPEYIVVKVPDIKVEDVKKFEERLTEVDELTSVQTILKRRKYQIPTTTVQAMATLGNSVVTISKTTDKATLIDSVVEKTA